MRSTKTARGSVIDMSALAAQHETTRAVSNVSMNARGDRLNQDGSIKVSAEDIAVAHQNMQVPSELQPISNPKPIEVKTQPAEQQKKKPEPKVQDVEIPNLDEQFTQEPEAISKITRTRDDGTRFVEIEYDDGSIETVEIAGEE